jgi:hypothetical protein
MRRSRAPSTAPGPFFAARSWAGCTTNMFGFDLRQAQVRYGLNPGIAAWLKVPATDNCVKKVGHRQIQNKSSHRPVIKVCPHLAHQPYDSSAKSSDFNFNLAWATEQDPVVKEAKSDAELEDMILQRLLIGGVFVSVRRDPLLGWRPTVVTAPKHTKNAQELADKIAAELRKKFTLKE